jgi:hypothetical protein
MAKKLGLLEEVFILHHKTRYTSNKRQEKEVGSPKLCWMITATCLVTPYTDAAACNTSANKIQQLGGGNGLTS